MAGPFIDYWSERPSLAVSSDDKYVYFAGLSAGAGDYKKARPLPCVFRVAVDKRGPAEVFVGKLDQPGKEKNLLTAPRGLAVAKGLLYVADPAANRVVAFKEVGSLLRRRNCCRESAGHRRGPGQRRGLRLRLHRHADGRPDQVQRPEGRQRSSIA